MTVESIIVEMAKNARSASIEMAKSGESKKKQRTSYDC